MEEVIKNHFLFVYKENKNNLRKTAKDLEISRSTAYRYRAKWVTNAEKESTNVYDKQQAGANTSEQDGQTGDVEQREENLPSGVLSVHKKGE